MQTETAAAAIREGPATAGRQRRRGDRFFVAVAMAATLTVFVGFARTYYLKALLPTPAFPVLFHIHGAVFTAWMLLLVMQVALVAAGRTPLHRRVGSVGQLLVVPMLVTGVLVTLAAARGQAPISAAVARGELTMAGPELPPLEAMVIPLTTMLLFGVFAGAGLAYRQRPATHKRFMMLATIAMLPAAIGRAAITVFGVAHPALFFGATGLFVLAMLLYDHRSRGRVHPVTLWGGAALMLSFPGRIAFAETGLWLDFAAWLVR